MDRNSVVEKTINNNLCIGCGICVASCPTVALEMKVCDENYKRPYLDNDKCINCSICVKNCPHDFETVIKEAKKVCKYKDYNEFGLDNAKYYIAYNKNSEQRLKSASGGIATYIAKYLLENKKIDSVIHAEMIENKTGEQHYQSCISTSVEEIDNRTKSFYCAISFDKMLIEAKEDRYKNILLVGTPCVVRGVKDFVTNNPKYKHIENIYTLALACSHNVNGMFTDYLAQSLGINDCEKYKVDLRNKENIKDADNFNNHYYNKKGTIKKINRFESEFTNQWRNYSFAMNVCSSCSDFWGYTADFSVKDAWGKWSKDPLGQSIVILRNNDFENIFIDNKDLYVKEEEKEVIINSQKATVRYKQYYAKKRAKVNLPKQLNKVSIEHRINSFMRNYSIINYKKMKDTKHNNEIKKMANKITFIRKINNKVISIRRKFGNG